MTAISVPAQFLKVRADRLIEKLRQRGNTDSARALFIAHLNECRALQTEYETMRDDIKSAAANNSDYKDSYLYLLEHFYEYLFELSHHLKACAEECNLDAPEEKKDAQRYLRQALNYHTLSIDHFQETFFATTRKKAIIENTEDQCTRLGEDLKALQARIQQGPRMPPRQSSEAIRSNKKRPATELDRTTFFIANKKQQTESVAKSPSLFLKKGSRTMALINAYPKTHLINASVQQLTNNQSTIMEKSNIDSIYQYMHQVMKDRPPIDKLMPITLKSVIQIMTYPEGLDLHCFIADPAFTEALKITALNLYSQYFPNQLLIPNTSGQSILHTAIACNLPQLTLCLLQSPCNAALRLSRDNLNRNFLVFSLSLWRLALYDAIKEQINIQDITDSQPLIEKITEDLQDLLKNNNFTHEQKQNIEHLSIILDSLKLLPSAQQYPRGAN